MTPTFNVLIAVFVLLGTGMQALLALVDLRENQAASVGTFNAIADLRSEHRWYHPVLRRRRRLEVKQYLREHPDDRVTYWRVRTALVSWSVLFTAAGLGLVVALAG